jgi:hypothetical protein
VPIGYRDPIVEGFLFTCALMCAILIVANIALEVRDGRRDGRTLQRLGGGLMEILIGIVLLLLAIGLLYGSR